MWIVSLLSCTSSASCLVVIRWLVSTSMHTWSAFSSVHEEEGQPLCASSPMSSHPSWKHFTYLQTIAGFNMSSLYTIDNISLILVLLSPSLTRNFMFNRCSIFFGHRHSTTHFLSFSFTIWHSVHQSHSILKCILPLPYRAGLQACSVALHHTRNYSTNFLGAVVLS